MSREGQLSDLTSLIQIWVFVLLTLGTLIFLLHVKPFEGLSLNYNEEFNEFMALIISYHLLLFTPFVHYKNEEKWGWSFFTFVSIMAIYNVVVMMSAQVKVGKLKVKHRMALYKHKKRLEEKEQKRIELMIRQGTYEQYKEE